MIDLATLTGAIIVALGHENAGVFSNDDDLCRLPEGGAAEGEGAWRMPLGDAYDAKLKSRIADMRNVLRARRPGRSPRRSSWRASSSPDMPWIHLDIAGTALPRLPKGAKADTHAGAQGRDGLGSSTTWR
jgi:leucyl aminopeptidase